MRFVTTLLFLCVVGLLTLGLVMLYSSGMGGRQQGEFYLLMQLRWCMLGAVACLVMANVDYRKLDKFYLPWVFYVLVLVLLILVFVPGIGVNVNGANRWINVSGYSFQPSEFAKLALVILLASYAAKNARRMQRFWRGLVLPGLIILPMLYLIYREPDWGAMLLIGTVGLVVLVLAGVRWGHVLPSLALAACLLVHLLMNNELRMERIRAWLDPEKYKDGAGYQQWEGMLAFGAGGLNGVGLGNSRQKLGFLPEHQTDFVFPIVGEELGFIVTVLVVLAFVVLLLCGIYVSLNATNTFGFLLGSGLTFLIGLQAFINMGVTTALLPNKGLPLPFISYGGSNLLMLLIAVGLLFSIGRQAAESLPAGAEAMAHPEAASVMF